jgi:predicted GNAT family acetyltransferase
MKSELTDSSPFISHPRSFTRSSLVLASLDIGRVLSDRDRVTFRAQGTCMYPTVRPGDILRIRSRQAADVVVGDIVICRGPDCLFGHRVIAKGERDGRTYIVTRPDRARAGSDVPTFDENLLGVVIAIERHGKRAPLQPAAYPWLRRWYFATRRVLAQFQPRVWDGLVTALARIQASALYRRMAKGWLALLHPQVGYTVRLPFSRKLDAVYRPLAPDEFDVRMEWQGRAVERWTLALRLSDARQPAAWATFAHDRDHTWHIEQSYVRVRYRGAGLDDALITQAEAILARNGMTLQRVIP